MGNGDILADVLAVAVPTAFAVGVAWKAGVAAVDVAFSKWQRRRYADEWRRAHAATGRIAVFHDDQGMR
jgi:hypothetical protein